MYIPDAFAENRLPVLHGAIESCGLAIFITVADGTPFATHLPMLLARDEGPFGTLHFHLARANPQWRHTASTALAIFPGPDGYVSPSWYPAKAQHGKVVPTWNYVTVHATGTPHYFHDSDRLLSLVTALTTRHESPRPAPWQVTDAPAAYTASMLRAIVGVSLPIAELQGKWKLGQNRSAEDRAGMLAGYAAESTPGYAALAKAAQADSDL